MHSPKPYGLAVNGKQPTQKDQDYILSVVRRFSNYKEVQELDSLRQSYDLPDGGSFIVQDMGGIFKVIVYKPEEQSLILDGLAKLNTTSFFSGVITQAIVLKENDETNKQDSFVGIKLTEQCRLRLMNYNTGVAKPNQQQYLRRLKIEYSELFKYFEPEYQGIYLYTQYQKLRPTWYSGAMSAVVQIVSGYGIQNFDLLPDQSVERAELILPEKYLKQAEEELKSIRLPGYSGFPNAEGQIQYEYGFSKSHAIGFDGNNKPWLLEISARGVYAMPLPIIPITTTQAFRNFVEDVADSELLEILDKFGGMPSGEAFPSSSDFETWRRAGVIIKVCDSGDFYTHSAMYSACGWSLNSTGTEGFNTCWEFASNGLMQAYGYKLKLKLGVAQQQGQLKPVNIEDLNRTIIFNYLSQLNASMVAGLTKTIAIQYKLRRVEQSEILERAISGSNVHTEINYWDALELPPIATHSGSMNRVTAGPVYWGNKDYPQSMGLLKFPEWTGQGCESFLMVSPDYDGGFVKCDTILFGCYVEDALQVVKYFIDERKFTRSEESTFEDYMYVGEWEKTVTIGQTGLMGYFYTTDFDDRAESPDQTVYTHIRGTDLGYGNPLYSTPPLLWCVGTLSRSRYYKHVKKTKTTSDLSLGSAICVPTFSRDSILYAFSKSIGQETENIQQGRYGVGDPNSYQLWCYDDAFHWMGQTDNNNRGFPRSKEGVPVYVDTYKYSPTEANDFADSGNWFGLANGSFIDVTSICGPYTSRSSPHSATGVSIGGEAPIVIPFNETKTVNGKSEGRINASLAIGGAVTVHNRIPDAWYFAFSPVDTGGSLSYFYRDLCRVSFGQTEYVNISETKSNGFRARWGSCSLVEDKSAYNFIGVINE